MGARKQRWTEEEEKALKAGIQKHGVGKWTAILKDPEFKSVLYSRSNVDLKDKYRNMSLVRNGEGSYDKTMGAPKRSKQNQMQDNNQVTLKGNGDDLINEMNDVKLLTMSTDSFEFSNQNKQTLSLELLILEAVACLKETGGSCIASIASYIVDNLKEVPDFKRTVAETLKALVAAGKLVKVNNKYKLAQNADLSKGRSSKVKPIEARQVESVKSDGDLKNVSKSSNIVRLSRSEGDLKNVSKSVNEGLSRPKGDTDINISADSEGFPTYEDRTAHEAAEAVAKAEILKAEYEDAVKRLNLAEAFVSGSHSLLEKLSMELSRRNARTKEVDMSLG